MSDVVLHITGTYNGAENINEMIGPCSEAEATHWLSANGFERTVSPRTYNRRAAGYFRTSIMRSAMATAVWAKMIPLTSQMNAVVTCDNSIPKPTAAG